MGEFAKIDFCFFLFGKEEAASAWKRKVNTIAFKRKQWESKMMKGALVKEGAWVC